MIENMRSYTDHTILGIITEGFPALARSVKELLINRIALSILISIPFVYLHPNLFAIGFVFGFIFNQKVAEVIAKVNLVYSAYTSLLERVLLLGGGTLLTILTLPTSLVVFTFYFSAQSGALLYQHSLDRHRAAEELMKKNKAALIPPTPKIENGAAPQTENSAVPQVMTAT